MNPYIFPIKGDVSRADCVVLGQLAKRARKSIMEFGVGGSTMILSGASNVPMTSYENDKGWMERTRKNLDLFEKKGLIKTKALIEQIDYGNEDYVHQFIKHKLMKDQPDLIHVDALSKVRPIIIKTCLDYCNEGTDIIIHDCRTQGFIDKIFNELKPFSNQLEHIMPCYLRSNMMYIKKGYESNDYVNWNVEEKGNFRVDWSDPNAV